MYYEQFKERIEEDLHQALADHGIDANLRRGTMSRRGSILIVHQIPSGTKRGWSYVNI